MTQIEQQAAFLKDAAKLILEAASYDLVVTEGELFITPREQPMEADNDANRSGIFYDLNHDRLAINLNFYKIAPTGFLELTYAKSDIQKLGDWWESLYPLNKWGGNFDTLLYTPHFHRNEC